MLIHLWPPNETTLNSLMFRTIRNIDAARREHNISVEKWAKCDSDASHSTSIDWHFTALNIPEWTHPEIDWRYFIRCKYQNTWTISGASHQILCGYSFWWGDWSELIFSLEKIPFQKYVYFLKNYFDVHAAWKKSTQSRTVDTDKSVQQQCHISVDTGTTNQFDRSTKKDST